MGRLTKDPDVRFSSSGDRQLAIARYTLAVDRRAKKGEERQADFINCVAFDRSAEFAERYLKKGTKVLVTGRIQTGKYENSEGRTIYTTDVVVEEQEFAESKNASEQNQNARPQQTAREAGDGFMNIPDSVDDGFLPFN